MRAITRRYALAIIMVCSPALTAFAAWLSGELPGRAAVGSGLVGVLSAATAWLQPAPGRRGREDFEAPRPSET